MTTLFDQPSRFAGLPREGFGLFAIADRVERREAILDVIHPALRDLGEDLLERLSGPAPAYHAHLPRLDWPRDYQPFCTWLVLSRDAHGYQSGPQLNVGVHADHVAVRLGWDTAADAFGRFEFLCRVGGLGRQLTRIAHEVGLAFRVYAAAAWPEGSRRVFESPDDLAGSFVEVRRRGVWWEVGRRYDLPERLDFVCKPELEDDVVAIFRALLPVYERN